MVTERIKYYFSMLACAICFVVNAQDKSKIDSVYQNAFNEISTILKNSNPSFKQAVFISENAYYNNTISYATYDEELKKLSLLTQLHSQFNKLLYYETDSNEVSLTASLFKVITDSIPIQLKESIVYHQPYKYNFDDYAGAKEWSNMFVINTLATHKGNCHSIPYLYKIIADELNLKTYFSYAPNHIYIKLFNEKDKWYNLELTSAEFPIDAWIMASGYIHLNAIQQGIYMDTIGNHKAIALCYLDLAQGYLRKSKSIDYSFVIKCCDKTLSIFPNNINAFLLKQEASTNLLVSKFKTTNYKNIQEFVANDKQAAELFTQSKQLTKQIYQIGYRKMPTKMYLSWLTSLKSQNDKYKNKKIIKFTSSKK